MPAIELERLEKEISDITRYLTSPARVCKMVRDLLMFYGYGSPSAVSSLKALDKSISFGTPQLVVHELKQSLGAVLTENPELALETAQLLWAESEREARVIAIAILLSSWNDQTPNLLVTWSRESDDIEVLTELANGWMRESLKLDLKTPIQETIDFFNNQKNSNPLFEALLLRTAIRIPEFQNIPLVFQRIDPLYRRAKGELSIVLDEILHGVAQRSPQETTRFLLDRFEKEPVATRRLIRKVLTSFPERQQQILLKSIST